MSDTKAFILEYYSVKEQWDARNILKNLQNPNVGSDVVSNVQQAAGVEPGATSTPSRSNTPVPGAPQVGSDDPKPNVLMGLNVDKTIDDNIPKIQQAASNVVTQAGDVGINVGKNLIDTGASALSNVAKGATSDAEAAARRTMDYGASLAPATSRLAGSEFTKGVTSSLGKTFSDPKTLAKLGVGALATGALVGGGMALGNRLFGRRPEKKKKRSTAISLTASYNPYSRSTQELGGAFGATSGSLGGLLGGRYAATKAADYLGLKQGGIGRTALEIGGQALGTVAGGTLGGMAGWELGKKRKKKKNEMLPQSMYS